MISTDKGLVHPIIAFAVTNFFLYKCNQFDVVGGVSDHHSADNVLPIWTKNISEKKVEGTRSEK